MRERLLGYAVTFGAGSVQIVAALVLSRVAFGHLGEADLRAWFVLAGAMPFVALFELGANVVLPHRFLGARGAPQEVSRIVVGFLASVLLLLMVVLLAGATAIAVLRQAAALPAELASLLTLAGLGAAVRVIGNVVQGMLYALGDNTCDKAIRIAATVVLVLVAAAGLGAGLGVASMPLGWACAGLVSVLTGLWRMRRRWGLRRPDRLPERAALRCMLSDALRYILIALPGQLVFNATPFIIAAKLPAAASISFGLTQQLIAGLSLLATLPVTVGIPAVVQRLSASREAAAVHLLGICRLVALLAAASLAVVALGRATILELWVGHPVPLDALFVGLYFLAMFLEWQQGALTTATMAAGNFRFVAITAASATLVVAGMPLAIDALGLLGVPVTLLLAQSLTCHPYNVRQAFATFGLSLRRYLPVLIGPLLAFAVVAGAAIGLWLADISGVAHLLALVLAAALAVVPQLRQRLREQAVSPETLR